MTSIRARLYPTDDRHRVTTLELLFDLVFVYAITNVTALMEHDLTARGITQGMVTLLVVWFGWCAYAWLGNQAKADEGLLRVAMVLAMAGMFFVAISISKAFEESSNAAIVLAGAYAVVRSVHVTVYLIAAGDDRQLRSVVVAMAAMNVTPLGLLLIGALGDAHDRLWWWLAAVLIDQAGVFAIRSTRWVLNSASHFAERFGLIIIIAIGESIIGVANGAAAAEMDLRLALALLCGIAISVCLWWLYFDVVALVAERVLIESTGVARARLARDSYTYAHLPMVAGIVLTAMGSTFLVDGHHHVAAGRYSLYSGAALYLFGHLLFRWRNIGSVNFIRTGALVVLLLLIPLVGSLPALGQLALPAAVLIAVVSIEVRGLRDWRARVRHGDESAENRTATPGSTGPSTPATATMEESGG